MSRFSGDAWLAFKAVFGPILTGVAFLLALLGPLYGPDQIVRVGLIWIAVGGIVALVGALTLTNMLFEARRKCRQPLPRTITALSEAAADPVTLILDPSELFGSNQFVSIYYNELLDVGRKEAFERLIGVGRVSNVQQNGLIQVMVLMELPIHSDLWQRIRNREVATLTQIVVKPSIPYDEAQIEILILLKGVSGE